MKPTKKLFISYRSSDAAKVDKIALDLSLLRNDDGTVRYTTWQDKHNLPPASPNWWDSIVDAIGDCDIFVFNISKASLQSEVCLAELDYAHKINLPIVPVVLDGEFFLDPKSGKYNILYWDLVPDWLAQTQLLFYVGAEFFKRFEDAVAMFERKWPRRLTAQRPLNPDNKSVHGSNHAVYDAACDYAERLAFDHAEKHFDALVRRNDPDYADVAAQWLEIIRLYKELIEIDKRPNSRFLFKNKWIAYIALFPKEFLLDIFNPRGYGFQQTATSPISTEFSLQATESVRDTSLSIMPQPFAWIDIPGKGYSIAKYPITNTQFEVFIRSDGYNNRKWWSDEGWEAKLKGWSWHSIQSTFIETNKPWTVPRNWTDKIWKVGDQPVTDISWHEATAFCRWLSDLTEEKIMLPTEYQWLYAAEGDERRTYPWGNEWNCENCNNSVAPCQSNTTTPVNQYEGKSDSPFGVVEMTGNVSEMCLTFYTTKENTYDLSFHVLCGGAYTGKSIEKFRCASTVGIKKDFYYGDCGFRICRS